MKYYYISNNGIVNAGMLEYYSAGGLKCGCVIVAECYSVVLELVCWNAGVMESGSTGVLEY